MDINSSVKLIIKHFYESTFFRERHRVRAKRLIFNMVLKSWADVKYHVPTGFGFSPKACGFYPFVDATALPSEGGVGVVVWLIQAFA